ncbi:hypothetical protein C6P46_001629 [Rhodotorula mucilaginosa]|uniref:mannan endo-1,4-beta-mannosidase n=1 Tax=Rhodotorula mucilaginosa TaxID=5537 RepID=A0A9P7B267_RHOMI|nr:hypothetical protein C6P46_001629 [Rhodotorula mucilaginosa]
MPSPTRLSIACIVGATLASLATPAYAHQPPRPRSHGAPGVPARAAAGAAEQGGGAAGNMLIDRGLLNGQDEQALLFGAAAGGDTLYGEETSIIGNWTDEGGDRGDAAVPPPPHQHLNRRRTGPSHHTGTVHRRDSSNTTFSESIAREMKLMINPKWIAMNPKWTPSDGTALGGVPPANASVSSSASLSASASTKTPASTSAVSQSATKTSSAATSTTSSAVGSSESVAWVLPSPPSSTCATMYTDTSGGGVYGAQVGNVPWSPRPSTFVVRGGNKLYLDGKEFRIVGPNIYWLGLDENINWTPSYPSHGRIREAMAISVAMGATTIRAHTLGVSTGHPLTLWPSAYNTNSKAWDTIDYSIWAARNYGLRLIVPLTDNYAYYHGGKYDFIGWAGADTSDGSQFYYNSNVIKIFKDYITVLLSHTNQYTGVKIGEDPTILGFETGNELGGYMLGGGAPPASWTKNIAAHIKSLAPSTLILDGTDGLTTYGGDLGNTGVGLSSVDLVTDHFYPALQWLLEKDKGWMSSKKEQVFYVGELDWTGQKGGDSLAKMYSTLENWAGSGSMMWSVFGHDDYCCNYVEHNDGYTLAYPNGMSSNLKAPALALVQHYYRMRGLTPPTGRAARVRGVDIQVVATKYTSRRYASRIASLHDLRGSRASA